MTTIHLTPQELASVRAALHFYISGGQGAKANRGSITQALATQQNTFDGLNVTGLEALFKRLAPPPLAPDDLVRVYNDPVTENDLEANAYLVERVADAPAPPKPGLERWRVRWEKPDDFAAHRSRWINPKQRISTAIQRGEEFARGYLIDADDRGEIFDPEYGPEEGIDGDEPSWTELDRRDYVAWRDSLPKLEE